VGGCRCIFEKEAIREPAKHYGMNRMERKLRGYCDENAEIRAENVAKSEYSSAALLLKHIEVEIFSPLSSSRVLVYVADALQPFL
jgi:hypothetical protein